MNKETKRHPEVFPMFGAFEDRSNGPVNVHVPSHVTVLTVNPQNTSVIHQHAQVQVCRRHRVLTKGVQAEAARNLSKKTNSEGARRTRTRQIIMPG